MGRDSFDVETVHFARLANNVAPTVVGIFVKSSRIVGVAKINFIVF